MEAKRLFITIKEPKVYYYHIFVVDLL